MKIRSVEIKDNRVLKNIKFDFEKDGKILNTIVIAGSNGSGKTTLLEDIYSKIEIISKKWLKVEGIDFVLEENDRELINYLIQNKTNVLEAEKYKLFKDGISIFPKLIYIPSEVHFKNVSTKTLHFNSDYKFLNIIDFSIISNIPSYIASRITYIANTEEDLTMKEVKEKVNTEINGIFDILELDIKLVGLSKDEKSMPVFTNSLGEEFDINQLSSGEKQLFLRTLAIKMLEPENSIILIDEPELSLHPKWQQQIIKVYEKIGKNNQIIIATHSPHILGSVPRENIILLSKNEKGEVVSTTGEDLYTSYGQPVNRILEDIMGLKTTRNPEVFHMLEDIRKLVDENQYDSESFKEKYSKLKSILGKTDEDLFLIDMEIQRKRRKG